MSSTWGKKSVALETVNTRKTLLLEQRQGKDALRKANPQVFITHELFLSEILKEMLQGERKLEHMEGLKRKIGL